jgi:hypothetical protein
LVRRDAEAELEEVKFIHVNPHTKSGAWSDADKQAVALWLYPGADGRQQRENLINGERFKLCSQHFRDYMLVPRGGGCTGNAM